MDNTSYKPKNGFSSNTNNFLYLIKQPNKKNGYVCDCDSCIEAKDKRKVQHCMTLKKTSSLNSFNYILYGSEKKRMTIQEFFSSFTDDDDEDEYDDDDKSPQPKKQNFRKPIGLRLPI